MEKQISVIIPTYKRPDRLLRAVSSVLTQSFENFEVLIVNDDKEDNSLVQLINGLNDTRLRLLFNERTKGANGARNMGILNSKGNYIAFLDDDDEWLPNNLRTQFDLLKETDDSVGLIYGGYTIEKKTKWKPYFHNKEGNLFRDLLLDNFTIGSGSNIFIKKEIIDEVGLWDEELLRQQDLEFLLRVFKKYHVIFNRNLILKVYGHNKPNAVKAFNEREKFKDKIAEYLNELDLESQKIFLSNHYRRQTVYLLMQGDFKTAKMYWLKAYGNKMFVPKKDVKIVVKLFEKILGK